MKKFILLRKKEFLVSTKVYVRNSSGIMTSRPVIFRTEGAHPHLRSTAAKTIPASFTTDDEQLIAAMYCDPGSGTRFVEEGDLDGLKKQAPLVVTKEAAEIAALKQLFDDTGLNFNPNLPVEVLRAQYSIHMQSEGSKIKPSEPKQIPHTPVNVVSQIQKGAEQARALYEAKYGEPVPMEYWNDLAFLDGLSNPEFDAKAYIATRAGVETTKEIMGETLSGEVGSTETIADLQAKYAEKFGKNPAPAYKNDADWLKSKLAE